MGGFMQGLGHVLKAGFEATPSGQRYQEVQHEKQQEQLAQEEADRQFADYIQAKGGRFVHNGIVQRDHVTPNGEVLSNALLDKAGGEGRQIISHGTGKNKMQWELPSADEQIGVIKGREAHAFALGAPVRQATAEETARNLGANKGAETTAQLGAQATAANTERNTRGIEAPDWLARTLPGTAGRKYLPAELDPLITAATTSEARDTAITQTKLTSAMQDLTTVGDQKEYDAWRQRHPEVPAGDVFNPTIQERMIMRNIPVADQPKYREELLKLQFMKADPAEITSEIDKAVDPVKFPAANADLKIQVAQHQKQGDIHAARGAIADTVKRRAQHEEEVLKETDPRLSAKRINEAVSIEVAKARLAPNGFSAITDPSARNRAEVDYGKSAKAAGDTIADARRVKALIAQAQNGNPAAPGVIPIAELRTFVNRVTAQELKQVSTGAGAAVDRIEGFVKGYTEGQPIPPSVLNGMKQIADLQEQLASQKHASEVQVLNGMYGSRVNPVDFNANVAGTGGKIVVTAPDGSKHPFDTQAQADAFKKLAGIK